MCIIDRFWEPGVTDIQKSQNVFYLELEDNETLLAAYPQLAGKLGGSSAVLSRYRTDDAVDLSEKTLVVDWYYKKRVGGRTVLHYCKYVGETVLYATENDTFMPSVTREARDPETGETVLVQTPVPVSYTHLINVCTVEKSRFLELEGDFASPKRM